MANTDFTQGMWDLDELQLIRRYIAHRPGPRDTGDAHTALTVLQAKSAIAARETAKATRHLACATFALAALTLALVLVEVFDVRF